MKITNEFDYIVDQSFGSHSNFKVMEETAKRACRIARMRGMMKAYKDCGCMGSYDLIKARLDSLLKNLTENSRLM